MNKRKMILFLLAIISFLLIQQVNLKAEISKEDIPNDIPSDIRVEIEKLYSPDPVERAWGAYYLGEKGKSAAPAIPFLIAMLIDSASLQWTPDAPYDWNTFTSPDDIAREALVRIGEPAVEPLINIANYIIKNTEKEPVEISKPNKPGLIYMQEKDRFSYNVITALGDLGDERAVEPLLTLFIKGKSAFIRKIAASSLAKLKAQKSVEYVISALKDEKGDVRSEAAFILGKMSDPRIPQLLITALGDKDYRVRQSAAGALGKIKDNHSIEPLIKLLNDKEDTVRFVASRSLIDITREYFFGEDPAKWQAWWGKNKKLYFPNN